MFIEAAISKWTSAFSPVEVLAVLFTKIERERKRWDVGSMGEHFNGKYIVKYYTVYPTVIFIHSHA